MPAPARLAPVSRLGLMNQLVIPGEHKRKFVRGKGTQPDRDSWVPFPSRLVVSLGRG